MMSFIWINWSSCESKKILPINEYFLAISLSLSCSLSLSEYAMQCSRLNTDRYSFYYGFCNGTIFLAEIDTAYIVTTHTQRYFNVFSSNSIVALVLRFSTFFLSSIVFVDLFLRSVLYFLAWNQLNLFSDSVGRCTQWCLIKS